MQHIACTRDGTSRRLLAEYLRVYVAVVVLKHLIISHFMHNALTTDQRNPVLTISMVIL